jgi:hypothetical protein
MKLESHEQLGHESITRHSKELEDKRIEAFWESQQKQNLEMENRILRREKEQREEREKMEAIAKREAEEEASKWRRAAKQMRYQMSYRY